MPDPGPRRGPRARMRKALLDAAVEIAGRGIIPSVSAVAEAAAVSRATAYRYFPSQAALVQAMVVEALGPIWEWLPESDDAEERVVRLLRHGYPRMEHSEVSLRAALRLALDQWARSRAGTLGDEPRIVRGNRIRLLGLALAPLEGELPRKSLERLTQALAVMFGTETMVVLKDMFGLKGEAVQQIAEWAARAMIRAAIAEEATRARKARPARRRAR